MNVTKESVLIDNKEKFKYMLHYNWELGLIWLSKNNNTNNKVRITTTDVYITEQEKNLFYKTRTGYAPFIDVGLKKPCSYILRSKNEKIFNYWSKFMYDRYMELKNETDENEKGW